MVKSKISQLQLLQQNLQGLITQKQQIETELVEIDSAMSETAKSSLSYRIIGKVMVQTSNEKLLNELSEKKNTLNLRLSNLVRQEDKIKDNIENLQQEVFSELTAKNG